MQRIFALALVCLMAGSAPAQTTFFSETFDSVKEPALPASLVTADASWTTSDASSSPGSGLNNGVHTGSSPGILVVGPIDLSAALDGTFSYWARRTSSYSADSLFVRAGTDGMVFGELLFGGGLPAASSSWEQISVVMPAALIGESTVYLQFEGRGGSSSGSNMRIDDVLIEGTMDPGAIPTSFGFGESAMTWDLEGDILYMPLDLAFPDPEMGHECFTYFLESGETDSIHLDNVKALNRDPESMVDLFLFDLTVEALESIEESGMGIRQLARMMDTSPAQIYRLLETTNYSKSIGQMIRLLYLLGKDVRLEVKPLP